MPETSNIRIERILRRIAVSIGILVAIAVPAGYGTMAYFDQRALQGLAAHFSARQIALYAYVHGATWRYSNHRVGEIVELFTPEDGGSRHYVHDTLGNEVVVVGPSQQPPTLRIAQPIVAGPQVVGEVLVEASLVPLIDRITLLGMMLGCSAYACVHLATNALRKAAETLKKQHALTEQALHEAQTERSKAEAASRSKSEFLANMSHELRTPLNAIIGFSDIMKAELLGPLSGRYKTYAEDISASGNHLLEVINDILDLAKIEAGQTNLQADYCDLQALLDGCLRLTDCRAAKGGVDLHADIALQPDVMGIIDETKTRQIVINLLSNAVKFTPRGGRVTLQATRPSPGQLVIRVIDTGIGMTPAEIDLAFQPFRQIGNALSKRYEGTGLGLPISRKFAEIQGGGLTVISAPNQGTTVEVVLPVGEAEAQATGQAA